MPMGTNSVESYALSQSPQYMRTHCMAICLKCIEQMRIIDGKFRHAMDSTWSPYITTIFVTIQLVAFNNFAMQSKPGSIAVPT